MSRVRDDKVAGNDLVRHLEIPIHNLEKAFLVAAYDSKQRLEKAAAPAVEVAKDSRAVIESVQNLGSEFDGLTTVIRSLTLMIRGMSSLSLIKFQSHPIRIVP